MRVTNFKFYCGLSLIIYFSLAALAKEQAKAAAAPSTTTDLFAGKEKVEWLPFNGLDVTDLDPAGLEIHPGVANLTLYVAQAKVDPDSPFLPGKTYFPFTSSFVSWNGTQYEARLFQVLTVPEGAVSWISASSQLKPNTSYMIYGGVHADDSGVVHVCRAAHEGDDGALHLIPGWYSPDSGLCSVAFDGKELQLDGSEVLVLNKYGQMIGAGLGYPGEQEDRNRDCDDVKNDGSTVSGIYRIYPTGTPFEENGIEVFCDMDTDDGGWIVLERRVSAETDFYRTWVEYQNGFGDLNTNFWLGLDAMASISNSDQFELRVDLGDWEGETRFAKYGTFSISDASDNYRLSIGNYSGDAEDSMEYSNTHPFSTYDNYNAGGTSNCAEEYHGAWWFDSCSWSHLNGIYYGIGERENNGIFWAKWRNPYSMRYADMKIRRAQN